MAQSSPRTTPSRTTRSSPPATVNPTEVPAVKETAPEEDDQISWDDGDDLVDASEATKPKTAPTSSFPKDAAHDPTAGSVAEAKVESLKNGSGKASHERPGSQSESKKKTQNIKSDFSQQKESNDPDEIIRQLEFYFHESNLSTDKYLFGLVDGVKNKPVPLETLHSFKRMRRFQPLSAIIEAVQTKSTMLNVVGDDTAIQRKEPLPEEYADGDFNRIPTVYEDKSMAKSIYAKGFGNETRDTQLAIEDLFKPYGPITAVRLRREHNKTFKGSVFVEFATEELQKAFLALDVKPKWSGDDLRISSKKDYCDFKRDEMQKDKEANPDKYYQLDSGDWKLRREFDQKNGFPDRNRGRGRGGRNDRGGRGRGGGRWDRGGSRGRGGRGGGRNDRNDRRDRNAERDRNGSRNRGRDRSDSPGGKGSPRGSPAPGKAKGSAKGSPAPESKKRARDDGAEGSPPAKKVDTKAVAPGAAPSGPAE